jgi:hypothetical protein
LTRKRNRREAQPRLPADRLKKSDAPIYGVNTGFGSLYNTSIAKKDLAQLQKNLVMSHACGSGDPVPEEIVRAMLVLKVQNMAFGHSAVALPHRAAHGGHVQRRHAPGGLRTWLARCLRVIWRPWRT